MTPEHSRLLSGPARLCCLALCLALMAGCAQMIPPQQPGFVQTVEKESYGPVQDLQKLPQSPFFYVEPQRLGAPLFDPGLHAELVEHFAETFYSPWRWTESPRTVEEALWAVTAFEGRTSYGENQLPRDAAWFKELAINSRPQDFPSLALPGIALRNTDMRAMPTDEPFFMDFRQAGEGYPFDYFQNSGLWAGTPLCITHATATGSWLFVETPFAAGWVRPQDVAVAGEDFRDGYAAEHSAVVIRDNTRVNDKKTGKFLFTAHVGTMFPAPTTLDPPGADPGVDVLVPVPNGLGGAEGSMARLSPDRAAPMPLPPTRGEAGRLARQFVGQLYGWGNMYENRDCSALVRDFLFPFGVWMPRNSRKQMEQGAAVDLSAMSGPEKKQAILEQGRPFTTLLGMPGHVMLYIGEHNGEPLVFHNMWGLKTELPSKGEKQQFGRHIVGRTVVTTLQPGDELSHLARPEGVLLERITTMNLLHEKPTAPGQK